MCANRDCHHHVCKEKVIVRPDRLNVVRATYLNALPTFGQPLESGGPKYKHCCLRFLI